MPPSADTTSNLLKGLKIVQSLSEAVPHGGILKAVAGVGITILETVERARVNREECFDIARRAAEHISVLKRLRTEDGLSDDLGDSLERYRRVLEEVSTRVEGLGSMSGAGKKWMFQTTSVQEETQMCLEKLDEAYQMYIFDFSIATDKKLTTLVNGMRAISLRLDSPTSQVHRRDEPDEIRRISMEDIQFAEEIRCIKTRSYRLRIQPGKVIDRFGAHKNVVIRKFESGVEREDERWGAFNEEIEWRRDLLGVHFARMLGIAIPSRRTKIIVVEAGSISAYDHLQSLSGLEFLLEHVRIMFDFVTAYQFLADHGSSWRGGYRDIVLNGRDNRLFLGALGRIDNQWKNSGKRMWDAFFNLAVGHDLTWRGGDSFDVSADFFRRATESLKKWQEAQNEECARELWACLWLWRGSSQFEEGVVDSPPLGEIGWREGGIWRAIPLVHRFPVACAAEYSITAYRCRDEENEAIVGTQTKGYTRWSFHVSPGEEIELQTCVQSCCTDQVSEFFCASALPLAHRYGVDVRLLRLVYRMGIHISTSIKIPIAEECPMKVYYFAYPHALDNSVPHPPGFWSSSPDPEFAFDLCTEMTNADVRFELKPYVEYDKIKEAVLPVFQDLHQRGFIPVPEIIHISDPPFIPESMNAVPGGGKLQPSTVAIACAKKRRANSLFSIFSKKRKTA